MRFVKVIYFDEGTAADYMQIVSGGELKKTTEFISDIANHADVEAEASVGITSKEKGLPQLFKMLTGLNLTANISGSAGVEAKKQKVAKNILENTLLADFVDLIDSDSKKRKEENKKHTSIKLFERLNLFPKQNSFSYFMLMAPFFTMIDGKVPIPGNNGELFTLDVSKIEAAIARGRGYYEFIATHAEEEIVFRFSSTAFRNNYTMSDLPKMELSLYAVFVGTIDVAKLDLSSEFQFGVQSKSRVDYYDAAKDETSSKANIAVYDVILAGITE